MYNTLTEAIKKRIILELRRFWQHHPEYRDMVQHIQGKYNFKQRPQRGIIVKNSSANRVQLSADNFQGTVAGYVHLKKVGDKPGLSIEWVRDDIRAIRDNGGVFPSPRGIYYIEVRKENVTVGGQTAPRLVFYVDPLLEVIDEEPVAYSDTDFQLQNPFHPGSLVLYEMPGNLRLFEGVNYTTDPETGAITLLRPLPQGVYLSADYRYPGESTGPYLVRRNHTNVKAIPGCVLAFGRRVEDGDLLAVVVHDRRQPTALEYGGRWELSLDIDIMARDPDEQAEIADQTVLYLWGIARSHLSSEGIEITNVSMGGESEEIYGEAGGDYFYNASLSVSLMSDWAIHVPLTALIRQASPQTEEQIREAAGLTDEELIDSEPNNLVAVEDLGLRDIQDPFFLGRTRTYDVIK